MNSEKVYSKKTVSKKSVSKKSVSKKSVSKKDDNESLPEYKEKDEITQFLEDTGMDKEYFDSFYSHSDKIKDDNESLPEEKVCEQCEEVFSVCLCNTDLIKEVRALREELEAKNNRVELLEIKIKDKQNYINLIENTKENLRMELKNKESNQKDQEKKIKDLNDEKEELKELNKRIKECSSKILIDKEEYLKHMRATVKDLRTQIDKMTKEKEELEDTITGLELEKDIVHEQNDDLVKELNELKQRIKDGYEYDIHDIRQEQAHERRSHQETVKKIKDRICELDNSEEGQKMRIGIISNLENQIDDLKKCIGQLKYKYYDINKEKDDINKELDKVNKELDKVKEEYAYIKKDSRHFADLCVTRNDELRRLNKEINLLINMLEEYEGLGVLSGDMMWTLQVKLETILKPDYKVLESMKDNHICRINRGSYGWY